MSDPNTKEIKLEIQLDEDVAQGVYSNLAVVNHSDSEFILDFIFVQPQAPRAKVRSRVITSPSHRRTSRAMRSCSERSNRRCREWMKRKGITISREK